MFSFGLVQSTGLIRQHNFGVVLHLVLTLLKNSKFLRPSQIIDLNFNKKARAEQNIEGYEYLIAGRRFGSIVRSLQDRWPVSNIVF